MAIKKEKTEGMMMVESDKLSKAEQSLNEEQRKMWDSIKNRVIDYYALSDQKVYMVCTPINIDPESLYIKMSGTAVICGLEAVLNADFVKVGDKKIPRLVVELQDKYAVVTKNPDLKFAALAG